MKREPIEIEHLIQMAMGGVKAIQHVVRSCLQVNTKPDGSLLTNADIDANDAILKAAIRFFPGVPVHSEESQLESRKTPNTVLLVDPLDGTTNFTRRIPYSNVSIALVENGTPLLGVIAPLTGGVYYGIKEGGSFFSETPCSLRKAVRLRCVERPLRHSILNISADQNNANSRYIWWKWLKYLKPPVCYRLRMIESAAMELCWLASGAIDAYMHPTDKEWDVAAGGLIAKEAGAVVMNCDFTDWDFRNGGIIAATSRVFPSIKKILLRAHTL